MNFKNQSKSFTEWWPRIFIIFTDLNYYYHYWTWALEYDQIGLFKKSFSSKFYLKSSPNMRQLLGLFWKCHFLSNNRFGNFRTKIGKIWLHFISTSGHTAVGSLNLPFTSCYQTHCKVGIGDKTSNVLFKDTNLGSDLGAVYTK